MKKIIALLLAFVLILCSFAGCAKEEKIDAKIGLAASAATHGWVAGVSYYAEKYCEEKGIEYNLTTSADASEMEKNLNSLVEWGAQAVVICPQWSGMEDAVQSVIDKGIPVVSFDFDIDCGGVYKVTGNNYDMGYQCAEYITGKAGESAVIAMLTVPSAGSVSQLREQGFRDYLSEKNYDTKNIITVEEKSFSRDEGYNDMKKLLAENEHIDAVFSMDDEISIGVVKAITESGRTDIKAVTGGGGMQEYFNMISDADYANLGLASALYSPSMVIDAINTAADLCNKKSSSKVVVIPTTIVSADNVNEYIDPENTVY